MSALNSIIFLFAGTFDVAQPVNYQGKLTDKRDAIISGEKEVSLSVHDVNNECKLT